MEPLTEYSHLPADVRRHIAGFYEWAYHNQRQQRERILEAKKQLSKDQRHYARQVKESYMRNKAIQHMMDNNPLYGAGPGGSEYSRSYAGEDEDNHRGWNSRDPAPSYSELKHEELMAKEFKKNAKQEKRRYAGSTDARKRVLLKTKYPETLSGPDNARIYQEGLNNARTVDARHKAQQAARNK